MAKEAPTYDLVLMLSPTEPDDVRAQIVTDARNAISAGGELVGEHDWGSRAMAYQINHQGEAEYHLFQFHATPELLRSLDRTLRITDGVIRHRIIKLARGTPPPPEMRARRPEADPAAPPPAEAPAAPPAEAPAAEAEAAAAPAENA